MAVSQARSRYRWRDGKDRELMNFVGERVEAGVPVTTALKEFGEANGISWLTARWKYYQMKRMTEGTEETNVQHAPRPISLDLEMQEEDFIGYLADFVGVSGEYGADIVPFVKGLSQMARQSREAIILKRKLAESETALKAARKEAADAKACLREAATKYSGLCNLLEDWLSLSQVEKVAELKVFVARIAEELGKVGDLRGKAAGEGAIV